MMHYIVHYIVHSTVQYMVHSMVSHTLDCRVAYSNFDASCAVQGRRTVTASGTYCFSLQYIWLQP